MASEVDICNLALSRLGDVATVSSINPPEGSAQAQHCQRFYPIARDTLLEMHEWGFATRRKQLAEIDSQSSSWAYAYTVPADYLKALKVLPPEATNDSFEHTSQAIGSGYNRYYSGGDYADRVPVPFEVEIQEDETRILYTDQCDAVLRYTALIESPKQFSPLFVTTLSYHLAASLAGPLIRGEKGAGESRRMEAMTAAWIEKAATSDANQRFSDVTHIPQHLNNR